MLAPVAHRQYVFTLPKLLRPNFSRHRAWLGELCRIPQGLPSVVAARLLTDAYTAAIPGARPGLVLFVQTFGDLANFNPHLHVLATDGVFGADGAFTALPPVPEALLAEGFRRAVRGSELAQFRPDRHCDWLVAGSICFDTSCGDARSVAKPLSSARRARRGGIDLPIVYRLD